MADGESKGNKGRPRPLRHWLRHEATPLARIGSHSRHLGRLQRRLQARLPDTLLGRWRLADVGAQTVTLVADTPAWAAALRFQQTLILGELGRLTGTRPRQCRVIVDPPRLRRAGPGREPVSDETLNHLRRFAESQADPALRTSLERLSRHIADRQQGGGD